MPVTGTLAPPPLVFPDAAEVFVQAGLLPRAYGVDGFRGLEVGEVAAVFGVGRAELELADERDPRRRLPLRLRMRLAERVGGLGLGYPAGPRGPFEGAPLVRLRGDGGPPQARQRPPGHRAFRGVAKASPHPLRTHLVLRRIRASAFSMPDLGPTSATCLPLMVQGRGAHPGHPASFLASHPSHTRPSPDWMGPSVRSESSGFIPEESKNALESIWSPFAALFGQRKDSKGGLFL